MTDVLQIYFNQSKHRYNERAEKMRQKGLTTRRSNRGNIVLATDMDISKNTFVSEYIYVFKCLSSNISALVCHSGKNVTES